MAWFVAADGSSFGRHTLQLPVRHGAVVWDQHPYVSPLVDVVDRGAPTGVVLVGRERVRLLHIEQGEASEPEASVFELELGDWRRYGGSAGGSPARGLLTTSHQERYDTRVSEHRDRLYATAAEATTGRLADLGWERVALLADPGVAARFRDALPAELAERIVVDAELNLEGEEPSAIAEALEPRLEDAWRTQAVAVVEEARERALAGGRASLGAKETLWALAEGRVERLVIDAEGDFSAEAEWKPEAIAGPPALLGERAIETAVATGAEVSALAMSDSEALAQPGGMVALLRY